MRISPRPLIALLALCVALPAQAQAVRVYEHPSLEFRFTASVGWQPVAHPEDELIYEVADPETGIHVVLWYTSTEQSALRYLEKMAGMKDMVLEQKPQSKRFDEHDGWVFRLPGKIAGESIRSVLAAIDGGQSLSQPTERALYIVQIWCPAETSMEHWRTMDDILNSVTIKTRVPAIARQPFPLYPATFDDRPDLPSPLATDDGVEYVVAGTRCGAFAILPVTVENGDPNDYNKSQWGKGRQLELDAADFPTLARTGLHAEAELDRTSTITGRPVAIITAEARPGNASGIGFLAEDEDLLSVIRADNRLVSRLGLTHPQLARPLFMVFNVALRNLETHRRGETPVNDIEYLLWGDQRVFIDVYGSKGWQQSLFDDEVLGYFELRIWRDLTPEDEAYLCEHYSSLAEAEFDELKEKLTVIHTGEMVPFYVMRYGFYEGHTGYRADPVAIASIFGLMSVSEIDSAVGGDLYRVLTAHHVAEDPSIYRSHDQSRPSSTRF